ncbi:hypothetical protein CVIRNUC_006633 [Coccomyxa viridis]|uniref:LisH domain-containing protein n=1 Tax=Coccomyxa viridis TaxID=1274662 RepID=A0AAV1I7V4_9CHLO|nr:hypothetical protein CVIRNUC_006633 [Coccomyxa viridis]
MISLDTFALSSKTLDRSLLEDFLRGRPLCIANKAASDDQFIMEKVSGEELCRHVRHYLSYHMIKEFEVLDFLEESGLHVEGMDSSDGDVAALERRWLKPIYTAAPQLVLRLLEWLCKEGHYSEEELSSAMAIAKMSVDELPRCAQLAHYLPGPTMSAYELAHSGNQFTKDSSFIAPLLQSRYQDVCPSENFWGLASRGAQDEAKVEKSHSARMHVSSISSSGAVTFTQCLQGSSAWPEQPACAPLTTIAFM